MKRNVLITALLVCMTTLGFMQADHLESVELPSPIRVVKLEPVGDELKFATTEIKAKAGTELKIQFVNTASLMPHTVAFLKSEDDIEPVGTAAMEAAAHDYIPQNFLDRIIAASTVAQPGETVEITFTVPPPGSYPYICTFPGHFSLMKGVLVSEE